MSPADGPMAGPAVAHDRWLADPLESGRAAGFGVYLHVPFCAHRCGYCDFATWDDRGDWIPRYVAALREDVRRTVDAGPPASGADADVWPAVTSVFVGGGTPTLLPADDLASVVTTVTSALDLAPGAEVTVECNPETASVALFERLAAAGVTRVSMGAQSFAPHVLETLERRHGPDRVGDAVVQAREGGIGEVNVDLIYGTPGETDDDWRRSLEAVLALAVDHVSAYALTIHDNTPFGRAVASGTMPAPDEDVQADRFAVADEVLGEVGFDHYEVSNWARTPALRSDHNVLYWRHGDYLGFGVGAHAHLDGRRWWSHRSIPRYVAAIEQGASPVAASEDLTTEERAVERLMLGLRLRDGIHPTDLPPIEPLALEDAMVAGLVETACGRLRATDRGWFLLDEAVRRLV